MTVVGEQICFTMNHSKLVTVMGHALVIIEQGRKPNELSY